MRVDTRLSVQEEQNRIREIVNSGKPCLIGKIGTNDGEALLRYIDISRKDSAVKKFLDMVRGRCGPFWWDNSIRGMLCGTAGVFPPTDEGIRNFCKRFLKDAEQFDVFLSWVYGEKRLFELCCPTALPIHFDSLTLVRGDNLWYSALKGKRVLVVHPYVETIASQYKKRTLLFDDPDFIPEFSLLTYKPLASFGGRGVNGFADWESALGHMCDEIMSIDFDIALIGAGGYGIPIGAAIKKSGRQAIHTGGATQLLFGIKGGRWDKWGIYNEHWVRPFASDVPPLMDRVESGCFV